ncbi:MAG: hypothetical protein AB1393_10530 [Candidatus Edwardsbacteria bacterium]
MTLSPILKVLFTFQKFKVKSLLIGGQACIIYGAAEFSRDSDFLIFCDLENLAKLKKALNTLKARNIYLPPLEKEFLEKGHACHFRCYAKSLENLRIDIISKLRGCEDFEKLWERRVTIRFANKKHIEVIGLEDLAQSKKTQRDKDWLMLSRLVQNDMALTRNPSKEKVKWWLCECRDSNKLTELANENQDLAKECTAKRPLLKTALKKDINRLEKLLRYEEELERTKDRKYWQPLIKELEILRRKRTKREK